jgi:uncharacterized repeat protein (TIGR01451 family)
MSRARSLFALHRPGPRPGRSYVSRLVVATVMAAMMVPVVEAPANASPILSLTPITWGVVGLDSNAVNTGPNQFAEGARLCNTGSSAATALTATFVWDSANTYVSLYGLNPLSVATLAAGACTDLYFNVQIQRTTLAYNTTRRFHIEVSGSGISTVSTPTPREVYVEKLVSQNRNTIDSVTGPTTVTVGNTYSYVFSSSTAPGGYEQVSTFLNWPNSIFQIQSVSATYTSPSGGTNSTIYADACGWQPDPSVVATYRSCVGPVNYTGGKAGGTMVTTYTVKVIAAGTGNLGGLVYDFSGSSYHYNSDWNANYYSVTAVDNADLSLTKSDSPNTVNAGEDVTYTLDVANAGPSTATGVTISDPMPAGTSFVSASGGGTLSGGTVTWSVGTLASGASASRTLVVHVDESRTADLSNTATVSASTADSNSGNNSDTEATTVTTSADLSITKSDSPDPVGVGQNLTYTLAVANAGPSDARNVSVTDTLPGGVSFVSATPSQGSCSQASGVVTCSLGTVADGATPSVTVVVTPGSNGTISNTASVSSTTSDPANGNNSDTEDTVVQPRADLSVTKGDAPDPVVAGNQLTYTMVVANNGPSTAQSVVLTDPLPAGTSFVSADGGGSLAGGSVTWNLGSMVNGASTTVHLTVAVNANRTAPVSNTATVSSGTTDPASGNDSATAGTTVNTSADLSIVKSDSPDPVAAGQSLTYTLAVANAGPSNANAVVVTDTLPAGVTYVSETPSQGSCSQASGVVTCALGGVPASGSASVSVVVNAGAGGTVTNTASVASGTSDPVGANNSDSEDTVIQPRADLSITKSDGVDPVIAGNDLTYTLAVGNAGPSTATSVVVTDPLPTGTSFVSATPSQGSCGQAAGIVTCSLGSLANAASATVTLVVHVPSSQTSGLSNTASVSSAVSDPASGNDSDTEATAVSVSADVAVSKSDGVDPVAAGTNLTYTIGVSNAGPSDATGVVVTDPLPAGTTFVSADGGGTESAGIVTWTVGALANAAARTLHVTVHVDPARIADLSNTVSVASSSTDPNAANDHDTEATTVAVAGDLAVTVDDGVGSVTAGTSTTYTITLTNAGVSTVPAGAVVTDAIPGGTTGSETEADCAISAGVLVCTTTAALAPGAAVSWQLTLDVAPGISGASLVNTAVVNSSPVADTDATNDTDSDTDTLTRSADLSVTKSDGADPVVAGHQLTYTLVVANDGPSDASGVVVTDPVPTGTTFVSADNGGGESAGTVTWNLGVLAAGDSATLHVTVSVDPSWTAALSNTASVTSATPDPDGSNDDDTEATAVDTQADVSVTQTDTPDPVSVGQDVTYQLLVGNGGPSVAQNVVVTDSVPAGTSFVSATPSQGSCGEAAGIVTCALGALGVGDTVTIDVVVTTAANGTITNDAAVATSTTDTAAANDSSSEDTEVAPVVDLSVAKSDGVDPVVAGTDLTYTITVANGGPSDATGVVVTDDVPPGTTFVSVDAGGVEAGGTVTWNIGALALGASRDLHVTVHVVPGRTADLSNTASVSGDQDDADGTNDSDTETTRVSQDGDLGVSVDDGIGAVTAGTTTTYSITLTNGGPSTVPAGAIVSGAVPAGTSGSETEADCAISVAVLVCTTPAALAPGDSISWSLTLDLDAAYALPSLDETMSVTSSPIADTNPANDTATDTDAVGTSADLSLAKSDDADPVLAGDELTYTIVVSNDGPSDAAGVVVTDDVPVGTSFVSADHGGVESGGTVTWNHGILAAGDSATVHVTVAVDPSRIAPLSNTAAVTSATPDPDGSNDADTEGTSVDTSSDLSISKTDDADPVAVGTEVTYTISVHANGPSDAQAVVVTDTLPAGMTFTSATPSQGSCGEAAGVVTCSLGALATGADATVSVVAAPTALGTFTDTATVGSSTPDPVASNDSASEDTDVTAVADLSLVKSDGADPVVAGTDLTYTIVVSNDGPSGATGVTVTDDVPAGTSFVSADNGGSESGGAVTWTLGALANGAAATLHVTVHVLPGRTAGLTNTASVTGDQADPDSADLTDTETTAVAPSADLSVVKTDDADPVVAGTDLTYTITVSNDGPSDATNAVVTDDLPAGTSFVSADNGGSESAGTVTWSFGSIATGTSIPLQVVVHVDAGRTAGLSNTANVRSDTPDPASGNDADTEATAVDTRADLSIAKSASDAIVGVGQDVSYTLDVHNAGPSDATNVVVTDALPAEVTFVSASPTQGSCGEASGTVTCDLGTLSDGADASVDIVVTATSAGATVNTAAVTGDPTDPTGGNDSDTAPVAVDPAPVVADLSLTKTDLADPVTLGTNLSYLLAVHNAGPDDATGVTVTDALATGVTFVSATPSQGSCAEIAGTVTCDLGSLADGADAAVTLVVTPTSAGSLSNTASVDAAQPDADGTNDSGTADTTVQQPGAVADLAVSKTSNESEPSAGDTITYTIRVTNHGPADATRVVIADALPAGLSYVDSRATQGRFDSGAGEWRLGDLANGASATLEMDVKVGDAAGGTIQNIASVSRLDQTDPDGGNDRGTRDVRVLGRSGGNGDGGDGGGTAFTGANVAGGLLALLALMIIGLLALAAAARRRPDDEPGTPAA